MSTIKGRLTKDAELKELESGSTVVNFTVAVNDSYEKRNGEKVERVEFFNCAYWFDTDIATKLLKGVMAEVSGWISANVFEKNGEHKAQLTMQVQSVKFPFVSKKKETGENAVPPEPEPEKPPKGGKGSRNKIVKVPANGTKNRNTPKNDDLPF
jgi:single-strand DNA-binding protein